MPSNYDVCLGILDRVVNDLEKKNLYNDYANVFYEQEKLGIIERFKVNPSNYFKFNWLPHRPVIRQESQVSTKIRPVFNFSLKRKGKPSLNDVCYSGVNLMSNLIELLLFFRTNKYVFVSDVKKAFLQIKLELESDRYMFCFF